MKFGALDEPTANCGAPNKRPFPLTERRPQGEVEATPTLPEVFTMRCVVVVEPMTNSGPATLFGLMEKKPHGVEVPMPVKPVFKIARAVIVVVPIPEAVEVER